MHPSTSTLLGSFANYPTPHNSLSVLHHLATSNTSVALIKLNSRSRCKMDECEREWGLFVLGLRLTRWGSPALHPRLSKSAASLLPRDLAVEPQVSSADGGAQRNRRKTAHHHCDFFMRGKIAMCRPKRLDGHHDLWNNPTCGIIQLIQIYLSLNFPTRLIRGPSCHCSW